jgi:5-methyltetrahydropteroyltriglutamate--homocysteine methyltransferase
VDRFLLEYDDWRTGSLAPLRYVPEGKVVVLGMVGAHNPELEDIDEIVARVDEAVDIDNISVSPDCGFASNHRGGRTLTLDEQFRKLRVVADIAMVGWGPEG